MATRTLKKTTKRKQASTARKTKTKWNRYRAVTDTPATGVGVSLESEKELLSKPGLKVSIDSPHKLQMIGRKVLMEEEPMELTPDIKSGLTQDMMNLISSGKLLLPDEGKFMISKYPYRGTVLSVGEKCKHVKVGDRVHFAPLGVHRFEFQGKQYLIAHEEDVHGTYAPLG